MTHTTQDHHNVERELKLKPTDPGLLARLETVERLGEFQVARRHRERQHNSFFDSAQRGLGRAHVGFRRRTIEGQPMATWTLKGDSDLAALRGVSTRAEIEVQLDPDTPPMLALGALRQAAHKRGAAALNEQVAEGLSYGGMPRKEPYLESETDRRVLDLAVQPKGWEVELALDRVRLLGHDYAETEIEAELKSGDPAALDAARAAIEALSEVRDSQGSKLSRALAHLEHCDCPTPSR